jgi:hypothetical protein
VAEELRKWPDNMTPEVLPKCNTPKGARASDIIYSIVESARENRLNPCAYLNQLERLPDLEFMGGGRPRSVATLERQAVNRPYTLIT